MHRMQKFDLSQNSRLHLPVELLTLDLVSTLSTVPTVVEHLFEAVEDAGYALDVAAPVELLLELDPDWNLMLPNVDLTIDLTIRTLTSLSLAMEHTGRMLDTDRDPNLNPNLNPKSPNLNPRILLDGYDLDLDVRQQQRLDAIEPVEAPSNEPPRDPVDRINGSSLKRSLCPCPSIETTVDHSHPCLDP